MQAVLYVAKVDIAYGPDFTGSAPPQVVGRDPRPW